MNRLIGIFSHWLPIGFVIFGVCGILYAAVQQSYRQSLNDPQIQLAEEFSAEPDSGEHEVSENTSL